MISTEDKDFFKYKLLSILPDKWFLSLKYYKNFGRFPNWRNPQTFNEKLNWLKLYDHNPLYTTLVDKYLVKEYVANIIGEEYIIPTLGVWDRAEDIDFDSLPNQFVLKANHDSGHVVICKDKSKLDNDKAILEMKEALKRDFYAITREWPYKNVKRKIIAEKYLEEESTNVQNNKELADYKFFCFDGKSHYCQVIQDRHTKETIDFYDMEWNHMPFVGLNPIASNGDMPVDKPENLKDMIRVAETLSKGFAFARVDLYHINNKEYFGEVTFYPNSGVGSFKPDEWNYKLGDLIKLPMQNGGGYKCLIINEIDVSISNYSTPGSLNDYKFFCFDGVVKSMFVATERQTRDEPYFDFYDTDYKHLAVTQGHPNSPNPPICPSTFEKMKQIASDLSKGLPHVRIDLYDVNGKIYFGEMTFFHFSAAVPFVPESWDYTFGSWLNLPNHNK